LNFLETFDKKNSYIKFYENPSSGCRVVPRGHKLRQVLYQDEVGLTGAKNICSLVPSCNSDAFIIQVTVLRSIQKKLPNVLSRTSILPNSEKSGRCVIVNVTGVGGGKSYLIDPCELNGQSDMCVLRASRPHIFRVISVKCTAPFLGCSEPTTTATMMHRVIFMFAFPSLFKIT
jgi:hypothetical protein